MITKIQKWGNSQGIRIPKAFLDALGLSIGDQVQIQREGDMIVIKKIDRTESTKEMLEAYFKKPFDQITIQDLTGRIDLDKRK